MFKRFVLHSVVILVLGAAVLHGAEQALASGLEPGDSVVTLYKTSIKVGARTLADVPPKTLLLVTSVEGDWGAVTVERDGNKVSGWVYAKHVRVLTGALPGSKYPIALHAVEGKQPGDPPKLYYSRRQAENVLGAELPDERYLMSPRAAFGGGGGMMLQVVQCNGNPKITGELSGTIGIMSMTGKIPIVLNTLPKGFHGVALMGTKKGDREQSQLSNWAIFEIK